MREDIFRMREITHFSMLTGTASRLEAFTGEGKRAESGSLRSQERSYRKRDAHPQKAWPWRAGVAGRNTGRTECTGTSRALSSPPHLFPSTLHNKQLPLQRTEILIVSKRKQTFFPIKID